TVRVLVDKGAAFERQAAAWAGQGLRVISDYGSFVLAEIPESAASAVLAAGSSSVRRGPPAGVRLRRRGLTPDRVPPPAAAAGVHILHFDAPARARWIEAIRGLSGARILMPLPDDAYVVWLPEDVGTAIESLSLPLDFAAPMEAADRVSPDLDAA